MFENTTELIFRGIEEKTSKAGNPYKLATFADPVNYQQLEFFCENDVKVLAMQNDTVLLTLKATRQGYSTSFNVVEIKTAPAKKSAI